MKREPRLQFTDEERASPELKKAVQKADKAAAKADKAQSRIPTKKVLTKERSTDPTTGKVKSRLRFEEIEKKQPSKLTHIVADASVNALSAHLHREVRQSEEDNVGVESAHKIEEAAESGGRLMQSAHRAHQLKPYRASIRAERQLEKANISVLPRKEG